MIKQVFLTGGTTGKLYPLKFAEINGGTYFDEIQASSTVRIPYFSGSTRNIIFNEVPPPIHEQFPYKSDEYIYNIPKPKTPYIGFDGNSQYPNPGGKTIVQYKSSQNYFDLSIICNKNKGDYDTQYNLFSSGELAIGIYYGTNNTTYRKLWRGLKNNWSYSSSGFNPHTSPSSYSYLFYYNGENVYDGMIFGIGREYTTIELSNVLITENTSLIKEGVKENDCLRWKGMFYIVNVPNGPLIPGKSYRVIYSNTQYNTLTQNDWPDFNDMVFISGIESVWFPGRSGSSAFYGMLPSEGDLQSTQYRLYSYNYMQLFHDYTKGLYENSSEIIPATITIQYQDKDSGKEIFPSTSITGQPGESYNITPPSINGYRYDSSSLPLEGIYTVSQTITLFYLEKGVGPVFGPVDSGMVALYATPANVPNGDNQVKEMAKAMWTPELLTSLKQSLFNTQDAIINLSLLPLDLKNTKDVINGENIITSTDTTEKVVLNGVTLDGYGHTPYMYNLSKQFAYIDFGRVSVGSSSDNQFWYHDEYTTCQLYLPFCGYQDISLDDFWGVNMHIVGIIDLFTGNVVYEVYRQINENDPRSEWTLLYNFNGNMIYNIPTTAGPFGEMWSRFISTVMGIAL